MIEEACERANPSSLPGRGGNVKETPHDPRVALGPDGPCFAKLSVVSHQWMGWGQSGYATFTAIASRL